jgi:hypothetical protein
VRSELFPERLELRLPHGVINALTLISASQRTTRLREIQSNGHALDEREAVVIAMLAPNTALAE